MSVNDNGNGNSDGDGSHDRSVETSFSNIRNNNKPETRPPELIDINLQTMDNNEILRRERTKSLVFKAF